MDIPGAVLAICTPLHPIGYDPDVHPLTGSGRRHLPLPGIKSSIRMNPLVLPLALTALLPRWSPSPPPRSVSSYPPPSPLSGEVLAVAPDGEVGGVAWKNSTLTPWFRPATACCFFRHTRVSNDSGKSWRVIDNSRMIECARLPRDELGTMARKKHHAIYFRVRLFPRSLSAAYVCIPTLQSPRAGRAGGTSLAYILPGNAVASAKWPSREGRKLRSMFTEMWRALEAYGLAVATSTTSMILEPGTVTRERPPSALQHLSSNCRRHNPSPPPRGAYFPLRE